MKDVDKLFDKIAENVPATDTGYIESGILHCSICHQPKQCEVVFLGNKKVFPCLCACEVKEQEEAENRIKEMTRNAEIRDNRRWGIRDEKLREWTFDNDDGSDPQFMNLLKKYSEKKDLMKFENMGMFIFGEKGTGKSFGAACLANSLIDQGERVLMSTFANIERMIFDSHDKNATIAEIMSYDFLIIDDFGAERDTEYQREMLFTVIDERYKANKPLILTSNINYQELTQGLNSSVGRVYDRVIEMCRPVMKKGKSKRITAAVDKKSRFLEILKD